MVVVLRKIICIKGISHFEVCSFGREIAFIIGIIMYVGKIAEEMFRFYYHIIFRPGIEEVFIFEIFKSCPDCKTKIIEPYIGKAEFSFMVFIGCIISTVAMIIYVDVIVLKLIGEIEITHLYRFQCIV